MRKLLFILVVASGISPGVSTLARDHCDGATESAVDDCLEAAAASADRELQRYEHAALTRIEQEHDGKKTLSDFEAGQAAWVTYRKFECNAVFDKWVDGTARIAETAQCNTSLARARTHEIWKEWLTSFGGNPPILPEPQEN